MTTDWDGQIGGFLDRLAHAQRELLALLAEKRKLLESRDHQKLQALVERERELASELQNCHEARAELLKNAESDGLPSTSIASLDQALANQVTSSRGESIRESCNQAQLIRHECLAQWVAMQRTLLHLSQMLEIIATGGRLKPTYGDRHGAHSSGALMDQAV